MPNRPKHTTRHTRSLNQAYARGIASLRTGAENPYRPGTYCWIEFNRARTDLLTRKPATRE